MWTVPPLNFEPIDCTETSVSNYQPHHVTSQRSENLALLFLKEVVFIFVEGLNEDKLRTFIYKITIRLMSLFFENVLLDLCYDYSCISLFVITFNV